MFNKNKRTPLLELREKILDSSTSLADILRRAKALASQLKNPEFKSWVHSELNGYAEGVDLPNYRFIYTPPLGTFSGSYGRMIKDCLLPTYNLPDSMKQMAKEVPIIYSVRELESMGTKEGLRHAWPAEAVIFLPDKIQMSGGYVLVEVHQPIYSTAITAILDAVRNRLLDFVLEINEITPDIPKENGSYDEISSEQVSQIFNVTIHGDHNIFASGETVSQHTNQIVRKGKTDDLKEYLRNLGIEKNDIDDLLLSLNKDSIEEKGKFGPKVASWIGSMISKAASGTWNIALSTAPSLITKGISKYYGWE